MYKTQRTAASKRTMALMLVVSYFSSPLCCARNNLSAGLNVGLFKTYLYVYGCFARTYICVPPMCLVPKEARREHQTHWRWNYGQSWATIWLLGIEPASSERVTSVLNNWPLSSSLDNSELWTYLTLRTRMRTREATEWGPRAGLQWKGPCLKPKLFLPVCIRHSSY